MVAEMIGAPVPDHLWRTTTSERNDAMKKISTATAHTIRKVESQRLTIGLDLGDRSSWYCVLDETGEVLLEQKLSTIPKTMREVFGEMPRSRIALETGMHSPWVSRLLSELGHEVIVAHARHVRLIGESRRKDDRLDARTLARLARIETRESERAKSGTESGAGAVEHSCTCRSSSVPLSVVRRRKSLHRVLPVGQSRPTSGSEIAGIVPAPCSCAAGATWVRSPRRPMFHGTPQGNHLHVAQSSFRAHGCGLAEGRFRPRRT
jgi:hypothetical protein